MGIFSGLYFLLSLDTLYAMNTIEKRRGWDHLPSIICQKYSFKSSFLTDLDQEVQSVGGIVTSFLSSNLHFA